MAKVIEEKVRVNYRKATYNQRNRHETCRDCKFKATLQGYPGHYCEKLGLQGTRKYEIQEKFTCDKFVLKPNPAALEEVLARAKTGTEG